MLNRRRGKYRLGVHDYRHDTSVCQLPAVASEVDALRAQLDALQATVAQLQKQLAAARKDSSTSSKPPSSDIVKPPKPPAAARSGAAQAPAASRDTPSTSAVPFPPEMLAAAPTDYRLDACPGCGGHLHPDRRRRADRRPAGRHRRRAAGDPGAPQSSGMVPALSEGVRRPRSPSAIERGGLVGPRLTTLIAYLKGVCHASFSTIRKFLRDVVGLTISRGQLAKIIGKVSRALEQPYEELLDDLPGRGAAQRR